KPDLIEYISILKKDVKINNYDIISKLDNKIKPNRNTKKNVWIEAYGCSANIADSEIIAGTLNSHGYNIVHCIDESDLNIIVTCSVKDSTEHKMLHRIKQLTVDNKPLLVAGCLTKTERKKIEKINPNVSLLGPNSLDRSVEAVNLTFSNNKIVFLDDSSEEKVNLPRLRVNKSISIVEIASGCLSNCSFCQTKLSKGNLKSYRPGSIISQIKNDVKDGCNEIWLTSTDNGCYGKDINSNLVELLKLCTQLEGDYKIRVGMLNPMYLSEILYDLILVYKNEEKIFKFLHIPVQSGSNKILKQMYRGHDIKIFKKAVYEFRKSIPEITIATDVIVGFPNETEEDFKLTMDLIKEYEPDIINISKYSQRSGTVSSRLKNIPSDQKKLRSTILHSISREISKKRNTLWKGWIGDVYIDEITNTLVQGRNYAYKSVIINNSDTLNLSVGQIIKVKVVDSSQYSLFAEFLEFK
ncbi:MAG TPA: tRNA (N(6)-L-threonylcarbamoyladenosine(37)-C(2))-methylthiotransferase, partial [Nitrososphaeraceae archaeon]|nr:tRNA (N(6)-L-threonylcarbamoyladenosine(37)-C(2))-methylthiotransferase [Nitrososphaeraceae archaeon]